MQIRWTRLPFEAKNQTEYKQKLNDWLSHVFYDVLPEHGYEVREEQIYTAFRMARALTEGNTLMAEAGPGTGKTFAYLLPAVCHARMTGQPVVVASASSVLKAQLVSPEGDIQTLSRLLGLEIDVRVAGDPAEYLCEMKFERTNFLFEPEPEGWEDLHFWAQRTGTGARSEVPTVPDELWERVAWDPSLACDTCPRRGHCHVMAARRHHRGAVDLIVCDHRLFSQDLLTRADRLEGNQLPILPVYSAVIFDEGHYLPETWQKVQGWSLAPKRLKRTLERLEHLAEREGVARRVEVAVRMAGNFFRGLQTHTHPGEGKRDVDRVDALIQATRKLDKALDEIQTELVTEEAMSEGLEVEGELKAYQGRIDEIRAALRLFEREDSVVWVEGDDLWVVPRKPKSLFGRDHLKEKLPVIFSSATLEPEYQARVLGLARYDKATVGVPFDLGQQALIYQPAEPVDPVDEALRIMRATGGRALILLRSMADVREWKEALAGRELPWAIMFEGEGDRGAQLERFREEISSVLVGAHFWEGVDVPGEALSCVIIPHLPFPEHDPLIRERRHQADLAGAEPFGAVDLPEMLIKLKQGVGRLIRSADDRGIIALLDRSHVDEDWAEDVDGALPEDAERVDDLAAVTAFLRA